jgi:hypothetical protein
MSVFQQKLFNYEYKIAIKFYRNVRIYQIFFASSFSIIKQLMPALAVNIIIVHPWDDVFRQGKTLWKTTPLG